MNRRTRSKDIVASLKAMGFDKSRVVPFQKGVHVGCSQCEAFVINGRAAHESSCPNMKHECRGCNNLVDRRGAYCEDCQ